MCLISRTHICTGIVGPSRAFHTSTRGLGRGTTGTQAARAARVVSNARAALPSRPCSRSGHMAAAQGDGRVQGQLEARGLCGRACRGEILSVCSKTNQDLIAFGTDAYRTHILVMHPAIRRSVEVVDDHALLGPRVVLVITRYFKLDRPRSNTALHPRERRGVRVRAFARSGYNK